MATAGASAERSCRPYSYALGVIELIVGAPYLTLIIIAFGRIGSDPPAWVYMVMLLVLTWSTLMIVGSLYAFARVGEHHVLHMTLGGVLILLSVLTISAYWSNASSSGQFALGSSSWLIRLPLLLCGVAIIVLTKFVINRCRAPHAPDGIKRKGRNRCPACDNRVKLGEVWCPYCGAQLP